MNLVRALTLGTAIAIGANAAALAADIDPAAIQAASTPAQHQALADQYKAAAAEAAGHAAHHKAMGERYRGDRFADYAGHCKKLAELYAAQAKEYEALAALHAHEGMAK